MTIQGRSVCQFVPALMCLAAASLVSGQTGPAVTDPKSLKQLSLEELSQLEVTSVNKEASPAFKAPAALSVLTSEQIHRSGARTIPDLLRLIPGVEVAQIDASEWAIGIRGFQGKLSRSVLVLIDGRSVYTPLFAGVYWDMQDAMLENIDRIEVIRGPAGTIWGSNAVNGVINIITKRARDTQGTLVSAYGGAQGGELDWRYGAGDDKFSYRISGKGFTRAAEEHADRANFDDWRRGQFGFRLDFQPGARDELTVKGDVYDGDAGQRLQLSSFSPPAIVTAEGDRSFNGQNILAAWRHVLTSGADVEVRTYFDRTDRKELNYHEVRDTFDADVIYHAPLKGHEITVGAGVRTSPSEFHEIVPTVEFLPAKQTYNIFSGFAQDEIGLVRNRLSLTLGSKFESTTFSGFNYQPSGRLTWTPDDNRTAWAGITRAVRTASEIEDGFRLSFLTQPSSMQPATPVYLRLIGDGGFQPEKLVSYEVGYREYLNKRGFINFSLFHNRYNGLESVESGPVFTETTPGAAHLVLPLSLLNGIRASSSGGEAVAVWDPKSWWRLRGSYSLVLVDAARRRGSDDASTVGQLEGDSPKHTAVIQSSFQLPMRLDLNVALRYVSNIPDQRTPAYITGDARLAWRAGGPWEFEVAGQNLFQPSHVEYGGNPGPLVAIRRSVWGGITWRR